MILFLHSLFRKNYLNKKYIIVAFNYLTEGVLMFKLLKNRKHLHCHDQCLSSIEEDTRCFTAKI